MQSSPETTLERPATNVEKSKGNRGSLSASITADEERRAFIRSRAFERLSTWPRHEITLLSTKELFMPRLSRAGHSITISVACTAARMGILCLEPRSLAVFKATNHCSFSSILFLQPRSSPPSFERVCSDDRSENRRYETDRLPHRVLPT